MSTIVTVHGTFASGPESGSAWWQKGSAFESEMRTLVEGADGRLDFAPLIWDGLNSECSRREAGLALAQRLDEYDRLGENYCLLGHSHGGSVIASMLMLSTHERKPRPGLSRWITAGTPFIGLKRKVLLFTRLGLLGRAGFVSLLTYFIMCMVAINVDQYAELEKAAAGVAVFVVLFLFAYIIMAWDSDRRLAKSGAVLPMRRRLFRFVPRLGLAGRITYYLLFLLFLVLLIGMIFDKTEPDTKIRVLTAIVGAIPLLIFHLLALWLPGRIARFMGQPQVRRRDLVANWSARWLPLRHPGDEAVEGLRQLPKVSFPIFGSDFAVAPLTFASVMALPVLIMFAVFWPALMSWLMELVKSVGTTEQMLFGKRPFGEGNDVASNIMLILLFPIAMTLPLVSAEPTAGQFGVGLLVIGPLLYFIGAVLIVAVARLVSMVVSQGLSRFLDSLAWRQIRASAYGSDTRGETAFGAGDAPIFAVARPALPKELCDEIGRIADAAATEAIPKLRASINRLAFAEDGRARSDLVSEYLTWDELIHTAYFKVPLFNKLVAFAIASSEGFRPSPRFLADPDYARVAAWYGELTATEERIAANQSVPRSGFLQPTRTP